MFILPSCGTMFVGKKHNVTLSSDVDQPVDLIVNGKKYDDVTLPYTVKIPKSASSGEIKVIADGYEPASITVRKEANGWIFANIVNLGVGLIIDAATNNFTIPGQRDVYVELKKLEK